MIPQPVPAMPETELFPSLDRAAVALQALALADAVRAAGAAAFGAHELDVPAAR
jgi:hypothetical protein